MSKVASSSLVGRLVDGRYRVRSHLADGGMGTVFVATDERLEREVALKVMRADLSRDEEFVARFRREARSAARLSHPQVVSVYDQGQDEGYVFLAMELVRGRTLRDVIRADAPLTPRAALDVLEEVLQALAAAHDAGLIHRDVKPENVLISDQGSVKVADFGLARAVTTDTLTTNSDILLGTAAYLAPEQVEHGAVDQRSDVYSAGLLLFEMLTGVKAYDGDSPIHIAYQHVHGAVPLPSGVVPDVPRELDELVARASAKSPDDRPADAAQLLAEVRAVRHRLTSRTLDQRPGTASAAVTGSSTTALQLGGGSTTRLRRSPTPPGSSRTGSRQPGPGPRSAAPAERRPPAAGAGRPPARRGADGGDARRRRTWWAAAGLVAALALVGVIGAWWTTVGPGGPVAVPDVVGRPRGAAVRTLDEASLKVQVREEFSETVPRDRVVRTLPGPGADQPRSRPVVVAVSKGQERYLVPQVAGLDQQTAQQRVAQASLSVGRVVQQYDENVPPGQVIAVQPGSGAELRKGAALTLSVSRGRQPIAVPRVTGQPQAAAESAVGRAGLRVERGPQEFSETVPAGTVIRQTPESGTLLRGQPVTLVVSKGKQVVTLPNVVGQRSADARRTLEASGLTVQVDRVLGGVFDVVRAQSPGPGSQVPQGSQVTITVF